MNLTWYNYTVAYNGFVADLVSKLIAEGWTQTEGGYNTVQPAGYNIYYLIDALVYGSVWYNTDSGTSSANMTYINIHMRAAYNSGTHVPTTTANGGDSKIRLVYNVDLTAEAVKLITVKGWIDDKHLCLYICPDATQTNYSSWILYMGEVEAVGAGANTCMLTSSGVTNEVGNGTYNPSYEQPNSESHLVHCLGNGYAYYPLAYGMGGSAIDSKVRTGQIPLWQYQADTVNRLSDIAYRLPPSVVRAGFAGAESVGDTFTDTDPTPDETFTRVGFPKQEAGSYSGYMYWHKHTYSSAALGSTYIAPVWIRSA
jgi:hypothetical protein